MIQWILKLKSIYRKDFLHGYRKIINHLSSRLRSRSQAVHAKLRIENAQGKILNFILVESALHPSAKRYRKGIFSPHYSIKFIVENSVNKTKVT